MLRRTLSLGPAIAGVVLLAACSQSPDTLVSPSAATTSDTAANADGSTLKVSAPTQVGPENGSRIGSRRPTVIFGNSSGRFTSVALNYRVQLFDGTGVLLGETVVAQDPSGQTALAGETDLAFDTDYQWRVRAEFQGEAGPWSPVWTFKTVQRVAIGSAEGTVGPPRAIQVVEAIDIIYTIYQAANWDIGSRSTRTQRNLYLEAAVAAIHYGHGKWNPRGPDTSWCIKNAAGRPQADDVIVLCRSREFWDLWGSIGADNVVWSWHKGEGTLDSSQPVYAPNPAAMRILP